ERAERGRLLGQQNLRLIAGARILRFLLRAQRRELIEERAVRVRERVQERRAERLPRRRIDDRRVPDELPPRAADDRALAEPPPSELRVIEDARAAADDRRVLFAD